MLRIDLQNSPNAFYGGDIIQGSVVIRTEQSLQYKEILVSLKGTGEVCMLKPGKQKTFSESEKYVYQTKRLAGDPHHHEKIPGGIHTFPFDFPLAKDLPSRFTNNFGVIAYFLQAEVHTLIPENNLLAVMPISFNGFLDLRTKRETLKPGRLERANLPFASVGGYMTFSLTKTGEVNFDLSLPRSGFVPGEVLHFSVKVENHNHAKVEEISATLRQVCKFSKRHTFYEHNVICQVKGPGLPSGSRLTWTPNNLLIPPLPPTGLGGKCGIIGVKYYLQFDAAPSMISGELPVIIGTHPLQKSTAQANTSRQPPSEQSATQSSIPTTSLATARNHASTEHPDLPPPTYEEAVLSDTK